MVKASGLGQDFKESRRGQPCRYLQHNPEETKTPVFAKVHGGGGLALVKSAREPTPSRLKPCASLVNAPEILPVRRALLALVGRKQTMVRDQFSP